MNKLTFYICASFLYIIKDNKKRGLSLKKIKTNESRLIVYGNNLESTIGLELTPKIRENIKPPKYILEIIIGLLLGDGCLTISNTSVNASFVFIQSIKRFKYAWHIFEQLKFLCQSLPRLDISKRNNSINFCLRVQTRSYKFLTNLHSQFYDNKIKIIPIDILYYLTPRSLAYWAMDDGSKAKSGFYLHTKAFNIEQVYKLVAILHYNFDLDCTVQLHDNKYPVIYIKTKSMNKFKALVTPYFHNELKYKLK